MITPGDVAYYRQRGVPESEICDPNLAYGDPLLPALLAMWRQINQLLDGVR